MLTLIISVIVFVACVTGLVWNRRMSRHNLSMPRSWHRTQIFVLTCFSIGGILSAFAVACVIFS